MTKAATKETSTGTPDARPPVVSGTPRFSLTAFFYAVINGRKYPAQQTVSADSPDEFGAVLEAFWEAFIPQEGDVVVYEPREVGPTGGARGGSGAANATPAQARVEGPVCPFHGSPTTQKRGPNGMFFSCSKKREDGSWCNWRPPAGSA